MGHFRFDFQTLHRMGPEAAPSFRTTKNYQIQMMENRAAITVPSLHIHENLNGNPTVPLKSDACYPLILSWRKAVPLK